MRISDWSSDVCSSDLRLTESPVRPRGPWDAPPLSPLSDPPNNIGPACQGGADDSGSEDKGRSEEHTSELQSLMRISYAVFCLKKKKNTKQHNENNTTNRKS